MRTRDALRLGDRRTQPVFVAVRFVAGREVGGPAVAKMGGLASLGAAVMAGIDGIDGDWPSGLPIAFETLSSSTTRSPSVMREWVPMNSVTTLTIFLFTGAPRVLRSARDTTGKRRERRDAREPPREGERASERQPRLFSRGFGGARPRTHVTPYLCTSFCDSIDCSRPRCSCEG